MKKFGIFAAAFAILASASCMEETIAPETVTGDGASFTATRADYNGATKTVLVDGCKVEWTAGNQVLVFGKNVGDAKDDNATNGSETFDAEDWRSAKWFKTQTGGSHVVFNCTDETFSLVQSQEYIMLHPAGGNYYGLCTDGARYMRFWLSDQTATPGTYNETYGYCAAKASDFSKPVVFKNLLPLLKFTVPASLDGRITKITVTSNNPTVDGFVAGNMICDYTGDTPVVKVFSEFKEEYKYKGGKDNVSLTSAGMAAGDYYLAIAPKTYSQGIKVTVTYKDGTTSTRSSSNSVELESSVIYNMGNVGAENYTGHGITGLPYMFSLTATTGASNVNEAKYLEKMTVGKYTEISSGGGYRDLFLYDKIGATLQCRQAGRYESDTQAAAYWGNNIGHDNIPTKSMVSSEFAPGYESYYKLTVPLRFQMPQKFLVTFGLRLVAGSIKTWTLKYSNDDVNWKDAGSINALSSEYTRYNIVVNSSLTINEVLYLKLVPVGTAVNGSGEPWAKDTRFWGGFVISDMSERPATPVPSGSIFFEAFDKMVEGVDYLMGGQENGTDMLGGLADNWSRAVGSGSWTSPSASPTKWNELTCSLVAMRPGYAQIGHTKVQQAMDWPLNNNNFIGSIKTPKLQAGTLKLSFKAMMFRSPLIGRPGTTPKDNVTADKIVVNVINGGTFEDGTTSKTISGVPYSAFQTQTLTIKNATADTQIEFTSPTEVPSTRWFIDDICVSK